MAAARSLNVTVGDFVIRTAAATSFLDDFASVYAAGSADSVVAVSATRCNASAAGGASIDCLPAYLHTCIPAYLHTCIPAYLHTCI
jgi:hypothetical protein